MQCLFLFLKADFPSINLTQPSFLVRWFGYKVHIVKGLLERGRKSTEKSQSKTWLKAPLKWCFGQHWPIEWTGALFETKWVLVASQSYANILYCHWWVVLQCGFSPDYHVLTLIGIFKFDARGPCSVLCMCDGPVMGLGPFPCPAVFSSPAGLRHSPTETGRSQWFVFSSALIKKKERKKLKLPGFFQDAGPRMPELWPTLFLQRISVLWLHPN